MFTAQLAEKVAEHDPVRLWRLQALERAGYAPSAALVLSGCSDVDLHLASKLMRNGCSEKTALRILL